MTKGFEVSAEEVRAGLGPVLIEFLEHGDDYPQVSQGSSKLVEKGSMHALLSPTVKFLVDASLNILNQPEVHQRLPREVRDRQNIASHHAEILATKLAPEGVFFSYYVTDDILGDLNVRREIADSFFEAKYLASLGSAPFFDARVIGGGALKFIRETGLPEEPAKLIGRSHDLLAAARIYKGNAVLLANSLGLPYASSSNFRARQTKEGRELIFDLKAHEHFQRMSRPGRGCPAGRIALRGNHGSTLLQQYWQKLIDYLIPEDATVEAVSV